MTFKPTNNHQLKFSQVGSLCVEKKNYNYNMDYNVLNNLYLVKRSPTYLLPFLQKKNKLPTPCVQPCLSCFINK